MSFTKVLTTEQMQVVRRTALKHHYQHVLPIKLLENLDPTGVHCVGFNFLHNDDHVRADVFLAVKDQHGPVQYTLDFEIDYFNGLITYDALMNEIAQHRADA